MNSRAVPRLPGWGRRIDLLLGAGASGICLLLYLRTIAPGALGGDAGELQFVPYILSLTHPTGYPLQTLLGKLWATIVPLGSVAYRMNLLSAVAGALAIGLVYGTIRLVAGSRAAAFCAALLLGVSAVYWGQAIIADKYALNAFLLALVLFTTARWSQDPAQRSPGWCALSYGLSLAHHRSMLVFLPLLVGYWAWRGPRGWWHWRYAGRTALLLVLPLLVYLWLPVGAARRLPPGTWHPATLGDWAAYLLDRGYLGAVQVQTGLWPKLAVYTKTLLAQFTPWGLALGLLGIVHQVRRRQPLVLFLGPGFLLQALFGAAYEVPRHWVFFLPSFVLFVVWIGDGLAWMFSAATAAGKRRKPVGYALSGLLLALALLLVALPLRQSYPPLRANHLDGGSLDLWRQDLKSGHLAGRFATYSLDAVAPGSIIVTDWEQATPLWYFQQVEGRRPDVQVIYPIRRWPEALATGRPCYLARIVPGLGEPYHFSAAGPVVGVAQEPGFELPSGADPISIQWEEQIELLGYRYYQTDFSRGYVLPVSLYFRANERPSADYSLSLRLWAEDGTQVWSHDRQHPVLGMYPMTRWAPGEVVGDYFEVPFPRSLPAGRYRLGIILYTPAGGGGWRNLPLRGEEAAIGHLPAVDVPPRR